MPIHASAWARNEGRNKLDFDMEYLDAQPCDGSIHLTGAASQIYVTTSNMGVAWRLAIR
jgi:hypothetical protein